MQARSIEVEADRHDCQRLARTMRHQVWLGSLLSQILTKTTLLLLVSNWIFELVGTRSWLGSLVLVLMVALLWLMDGSYALQRQPTARPRPRIWGLFAYGNVIYLPTMLLILLSMGS